MLERKEGNGMRLIDERLLTDDMQARHWHLLNGELVFSTAAAPVSPIRYREKADALLKMWMDDELTDGEYYKIMDRLNQKR